MTGVVEVLSNARTAFSLVMVRKVDSMATNPVM